MDILEKVFRSIRRWQMLEDGDSVVVAFSGGPDSTALLDIILRISKKMNLEVYAAYLNHMLRGKESDEEEEFVKKFISSLGVKLFSAKEDVLGYSKHRGISVEMGAREVRYSFLEKAKDHFFAKKVALGHNADDHLETVILRLLRGTSSLGLCGIPPKRGFFVRPLIEVERKEILDYLKEKNLPYFVDTSNLLDHYPRNYVRHHIIPEMKKMNPAVSEKVLKLSAFLRDDEDFISSFVDGALKKVVLEKSENKLILDLESFNKLHVSLRRRVLFRTLFPILKERLCGEHIDSILSLGNKGPNKEIYLPKGFLAKKVYTKLMIGKRVEPKDFFLIFHHIPKVIEISEIGVKFQLEIRQGNISEAKKDPLFLSKKTAFLDLDNLSLPIIVRPYKKGDYFYIVGNGRKKIKDLFIDRKIPKDERKKIPIFVFGDKIGWVFGISIDDRFKLKESTKRYLVIKMGEV